MSTSLEEKLAPQRPSDGGRARARLSQLLARWGANQVTPDCVLVRSMFGAETWRRVTGDLFEQESNP